MKEIKCLDCDKKFQAESSDEALKQMHPHYMSDHQDVMSKGTEEKKKEWFEKFSKAWEDAAEL